MLFEVETAEGWVIKLEWSEVSILEIEKTEAISTEQNSQSFQTHWLD